MTAARKLTYLILSLGLLAGLVAGLTPRPPREPDPLTVRHIALKPVCPSGLDAAPPEVQEFLARMLEKVPENGSGVTGYHFFHWEWKGKATHEAIGLKAISGADPGELIARIRDVDGYATHIAHVEACRSEPDPAFTRPESVRFFQLISVPGIAKVQQDLVLVDAGTFKGYRVVYWYLLKDQTAALSPKAGARSDFNIGAWFAAPGVVGYALELLAPAVRCECASVDLSDLRRECPGEADGRGQHRRHGGMGKEVEGSWSRFLIAAQGERPLGG